jgi:hypothetical protein
MATKIEWIWDDEVINLQTSAYALAATVTEMLAVCTMQLMPAHTVHYGSQFI